MKILRVRSIVGNFLEHSRIFYFSNAGKENVFLGSADWMPRNLERRVEIMFPVEAETLKQEIIHVLQMQLSDTLKARILTDKGTYERIDKRGKALINSQDEFCKAATAAVKSERVMINNRIFVPEEHVK